MKKAPKSKAPAVKRAAVRKFPKAVTSADSVAAVYIVNAEEVSKVVFEQLEADPGVKLRKIGQKRTYAERVLIKRTHYYRMK